jgi:hypothetical protein
MGYMAETQRQMLALVRAYTGIAPVAPALAPVPSPGPATVSPTPVSISISPTAPEIWPLLVPSPLPVVAEPLGRVRQFTPGTAPIVTTASFQEVIGYKVTNEKEFDIAYFTISADQDVLAKLIWGAIDFTQTYYVVAKVPFVMYFPAKFYGTDGKPIIGDGKTKLSLQACYPAGGSATVNCFGEIAGDEL